MRLLAVLVFTLYFSSIYTQHTELDSLIGLLTSSSLDKQKVDLLNEIAYKSSLSNVDSSFSYALQALDLAIGIGYESGQARALNIKSNKYLLGQKHLQSILLNTDALAIAQKIDDHKNISRIYNSIAVNYYNMGDQETAIKNLQLAADASLLIKDTTRLIFTLSNIGYLHLQNKSLDHAEKYLLNVKQLAEESNSQIGKRLVSRHLGALYAALDNYDLTLKYFQQGIQLSTEETDLFNLAWNKALLGKYLSEKQSFAKAEQNLYEGLKLFEQRKDLENQLEVCVYLAEHFNRKKEYPNAIKTSSECLENIDMIGNDKHKLNLLKQLSLAYEGMRDTDNAYKYYKQYKVYSDTLRYKEKSLKAMELESKYQIQKKEVENKLLVEEQAKQRVIINRRNITILASFALLFLSACIALLFWRNVKKEQNFSHKLASEVQERTLDLQIANKELLQSNQELERFAYIASHDLKEPVRNIISFTELLEKEIGTDSNEKVNSFMNIIRQNSNQLFSLIRDTLEFSKIERDENVLETVDLNKIIDSIELSISGTIKKRNAKISVVKPLPIIKANRTKLFIVLKNLIENGLKYNENESPQVIISHMVAGNEYIFSLEDNGIGINPEYHDKIFEMYKRLQKKEGMEGTGLGLASCKKIIQQLGGNIWVESIYGEGSKFKFTLPLA